LERLPLQFDFDSAAAELSRVEIHFKFSETRPLPVSHSLHASRQHLSPGRSLPLSAGNGRWELCSITMPSQQQKNRNGTDAGYGLRQQLRALCMHRGVSRSRDHDRA
jgi:hypothetical protein